MTTSTAYTHLTNRRLLLQLLLQAQRYDHLRHLFCGIGFLGMAGSSAWAVGPHSIDYLPVGRPPLPPAIQQAIEQGDSAGLDEVARSLRQSQQRMPPPAPAIEQVPMPGSALPVAPANTTAAASAAPATPAQALNELYFKGRYGDVGTQGLALLQANRAQVDDELRLKIANSLAWSNRLEQAVAQYEDLVRNSTQAQAARMPLANAYRWQGRPDLAVPLYQDTLLRDKTNQDAQEGLEYAERDLRPRTIFKIGSSSDSSDLSIRNTSLAHRWRDNGRTQIFEVETDWRSYTQAPSGPNPHYFGGSFRYEHTGLAFQPRVHLSVQGRPNRGLFGGLKVKLGELPVHAELAREDFGATALSARALDAGLTANRLGLEGQFGGSWGSVSGRVNLYDISDKNWLRTMSLKYAPEWRPLGPAFKPYISIDTRDVKFNTPNYWSPIDGSGSFGIGAAAEWAEKDWFFYVIGQKGTRLYGEAGNIWSASIGGQRWLSRDLAVTANLWALSSIRDQAKYTARSFTVKIDKLW